MRLTPDGAQYLALARGEKVQRPFHYRWLLPRVLGPKPERWVWCSRISLVALAVAAFTYTHDWRRGLFVAVSMLGLAGVSRFNLQAPVLVDLPAIAVALSAAAMAPRSLAAAVALVCIAGCTKETAPVFAAIYAWTPWMLIGLLPVAIRAVLFHSAPTTDPILRHPIRASIESHASRLAYPQLWVWPWGALLIGLYRPTWQVVTVLAVAYGQTLIATDTVRLYQWAWPVLAVATTRVLPVAWLLPIAVLHIWSPFVGDGV